MCIYVKSAFIMRFDEYLKNRWDSLPGTSADSKTEMRIWKRIRRRMWIEKYGWGVATVAAAACLVAGIMLWSPIGRETYDNQQTLITYTAAQNEELLLPDGSKVWLETGSTLTYPDVMDAGERTVSLDGNAVFEVCKKDDGQHFIVNMESSFIEVKGTSFSINRVGSDAIAVVLFSGAVDFVSTSNGQTVVMKPSNKLTFNLKDQSIHVAPSFPGITWNDGFYMVKNAPLSSLADFVSWRYGVKVELSGTIENTQKMNGKISYNDTCDAVMDKLCYILGINYSEKDGIYRISGR